jgi:hemerythrin-like domain-containing protein
MGWRKILKREHEAVLEVLDAAEREARRMEETGEARLDVLHDLLEFFRHFNDGIHDPKEEELLFARCVKRGMGEDVGQFGRLMKDHDETRGRVNELRDAYRSVRDGKGETPAGFAQRLHDYDELIRAHIEIEDDEFFDLAQGYLTIEDRRELSEEFDSAHEDETEEGVFEYFEELGRRLSRS